MLMSLVSDSTLPMRSVNALVVWNDSLHVFCVRFELAAIVLVAVNVADAV